MTSHKALENSIFWQNWVLKQTKDPKQKQRAIAAIEKLMAQLKALDKKPVDPRIDGYNVEFLGAKPPRAGEDY